ncbi:uncharacterized protein [Cicer arietinum]|uniref:Myoneurin n=1 Tax=Cicer arietinum TaxID=3827 RepID=A0A1S2XT41_CICAR|nr:myoneurin [Cicer arietinum]
MGRGRGKGKKQSANIVEDLVSDEEDKLPAHRKRGRPLKPLTDENEEIEVAEKIEKDEKNVNGDVSSNDLKTQVITVNKRKRKRSSSQVKEKIEPMKEDNGVRAKSSPADLVKSTGFRQNGSRRKSKPRRAAEAGVDCK